MIKQIKIEVVPVKSMRYATLGDYLYHPDTQTLEILVGETQDWREAISVAVHELVEAVLCLEHKIEFERIDEFDMEFEKNRDASSGEPGDHPFAPYYHEHRTATDIEKIFTQHIGLDWDTYNKHLDDAFIEWGE